MKLKTATGALAGVFPLFLLAASLSAATHTWTGAVSSLWSNSANWTGGTPAEDPSADLVFPATTRLVSTNDIPGVTYVNTIYFSHLGYTIDALPGSSIALAGVIMADSPATNITISLPITLYGGGNHGATGLPRASPTFLFSGVVSGAASENFGLIAGYSIDVTLSADNTYSGTSRLGLHSELTVLGSQPNAPIHVGPVSVLKGTGTVGNIQVESVVAPGTSVPGILTVAGDAVFSSEEPSTFRVRLNGTTPGVGYDRLDVQGELQLSSVKTLLDVRLGFVPAVGDAFTIVQAAGGIVGFFNTHPEGTIFGISCLSFQIHYTATSVVLTRVAGGGPPVDSVLIEATGSRTACTNGTDGTVTVTDEGGCNNTHRWGYRTASGGPITTIPGETGSTYSIDGHDFPGVGTYYLVETTTPGFGSPVNSNELVVTIVSPPPAVASGSATISCGGSTTLSGSGAANCSWSPAWGLNDPNSCQPVASPGFTTTYSLTVSGPSGCTSTNTAQGTVTVDPACPGSVSAPYYTVPPCRLVDTREPPEILAGGSARVFPVVGSCGIPQGATSVVLNVTVVKPKSDGFLTLYAAGAPRPLASAINYRAGQVRANSATVLLSGGPSGGITVFCGGVGDTDVILDVSGYYQ